MAKRIQEDWGLPRRLATRYACLLFLFHSNFKFPPGGGGPSNPKASPYRRNQEEKSCERRAQRQAEADTKREAERRKQAKTARAAEAEASRQQAEKEQRELDAVHKERLRERQEREEAEATQL